MPERPRERRDDILDVARAWSEAMRRHYPGVIGDDHDRRLLAWHEAATTKAVLKGGEEFLRDIAQSMPEWSLAAKRDFHEAVQEKTGQTVPILLGPIERQVARLLKRRRPLDEFDLRLLRDYVADGAEGSLAERASLLLDQHGA